MRGYVIAWTLAALEAGQVAAECTFGRQVQGRINQLLTGPVFDGDVVIQMAGLTYFSGSPPTCSTNDLRFRFSGEGAQGRLTYSTALAAYLGERRITLVGCDECTLRSNTEDLRWLRLD